MLLATKLSSIGIILLFFGISMFFLIIFKQAFFPLVCLNIFFSWSQCALPFRMLDFSFPSVLIADLYVVKDIFLYNSLFSLSVATGKVNVEPWCVFQYVSYFRLVHSSFFNFPLTQTLILWLRFCIIFFLCFHNFLKHQSSLFIIPYLLHLSLYRDFDKSLTTLSCSVFLVRKFFFWLRLIVLLE